VVRELGQWMFRTNTRNNFFKALLSLSRVKKAISLATLAVFAVSCTPSEKILTEEDIKGGGTFAGVTEVQTLSSTQINVLWTQSTNPNVTGYNIYDATLKSQPRLVKTVGAESSEAVISGLSEGFLYRYRVRAVSKGGYEDNNEEDKYGIPYGGAQSVNVVSSTSVELNFIGPVATEVRELRVYCRNENETEYVSLASIRNVSTTRFTITGLLPNIDYTCRVASVVDGQEDNNQNTVTFKALGRADKIVFGVQPGNADAGAPLTSMPVVRVLDENDNIVSGGPDAEAFITLTVAVTSPTGGTVRGTATVTAIAGVANFADLFMQEAGIKVLTATKSDTSSAPGGFGTAPMTVNSTTFSINPGNISPTLTTMTVENAVTPGSTPVANGTDAYTVTFNLKDDFGNAVTGIRPQFASNVPGDFFSQPLSPSDSAGITTGSIATNVADTNGPTTRILRMSSPAGFDAIQVAAPFDPGPATKLAFTSQPTNSPAGDFGLNDIRVSVQDNFGNTITSGGAASTSISISIANNVGGATLSGTNSKAAINGVALFDDLGIDNTANGYKLAAAGGVLTPVQSNNFNVTAGIPRVISMTGGDEVLSGACSGQIILQLQDFGGNPAKAVANTTIQLSGLGNASMYTSASCGGAPIGSSVTYTPGQDTKFLYIQSSKVESLTIIGSDSSAVLTASSYDIFVTPSQMRMIAQAAPPAPGGTALSVTAGQCSTAITITPLASDGSVGRVFTPTSVQISGILGSQARIYSDSSCLTQLDETDITLSMASPPNEDTVVYLRDPRGESLLINAIDPSSDIATVSLPQEVNVLASEIEFLGPTTVVAGTCSAVFTINLKDTLDFNVPTVADTTLTVVGMSGSPSGQFFTSPSCSGGGSNSSILIPEASSSTSVYYRGNNAEILNLQITDPAGNMTASAVINLEVSPSSLFITNPTGPDESDTSVCSARFRVRLRDGAGANANAVSTIVANISGGGTSGKFFSDSTCETQITSLTFNPGSGFEDFYYKGQYPETGLSITVTDNASVLTADSQSWNVTAQISWLGGAGQAFSSGVNLLPFRTGLTQPLAARVNGVRQAWHMAMDPTKQYLYVVDRGDQRVLKYDYTNMTFVGWMGRLRQEGGLAVTGSTLATPSTASCIGTTNLSVLPGWCLGGGSNSGSETTGGFGNPRGITVDDTYLYVVNESSDSVNRYRADTGEFEGWIGTKNNSDPSGPATGGPASCNVSNDEAVPGWCIGGNSRDPGSDENRGDGRLKDPKSVAHDSLYLYVGQNYQVKRFDKATGSFQGWIGRIEVSPTSNASGAIGDCTLFGNDDLTPGWCNGGRAENDDPRDGSGGINTADDIVVDIPNNRLYVLMSNFGGIVHKYNLTTGAFIEKLNTTNNYFQNAQQMFLSGGKLYIAADERIIRIDSAGDLDGWMGKVSNNVGMADVGGTGCNSLLPNQNTNGWCIGGSQKSGLEERAFINQYAIVDDGSGSFLTTSFYRPLIKKFDIATGAYQGSIGMESSASDEWSGDLASGTQQEGSGDNDYYSPAKPLIVGDILYVADTFNSRIKKINKRTGELIGWIGGITTVPTGGENSSLCTSVNPMRASPHFCTGATPYPFYTWGDQGMIDDTANGIMELPMGLATDGIYLYVTDRGEHRVQRFDLNTGAYGGWIGRINQSPNGGAPGCVGAPNNSFTPGWCLGGSSESGNEDGNLNSPSGITYVAGNLYVIDHSNSRISRYNATSGNFSGWIGRINASPSSGCTTINRGSGTVSETGWCLGGTSRNANDHTDRGGGFYFNYGSNSDIQSDGLHLYVGNKRNSRLDKIAFDGSFVETTRTREDSYADGWKSLPADVGDAGNTARHRSMPQGIFIDATHIYVSTAVPNQRRNEPAGIVKVDKLTGLVIGWKGGIDPDNPPTGGDPGCLGAIGITPGWCTGGNVSAGTLPGQTAGYYGSLTGDEFFLYVTDEAGHRITRIPK
jgi:hypothetical protein